MTGHMAGHMTETYQVDLILAELELHDRTQLLVSFLLHLVHVADLLCRRALVGGQVRAVVGMLNQILQLLSKLSIITEVLEREREIE